MEGAIVEQVSQTSACKILIESIIETKNEVSTPLFIEI
jgi:hypothetical protein